jgi:hypothetical protein
VSAAECGECDCLIKIGASTGFTRTRVFNTMHGYRYSPICTSQHCDLEDTWFDEIILPRICRTFRLDCKMTRGGQILRYEPGQHFLPHHDPSVDL